MRRWAFVGLGIFLLIRQLIGYETQISYAFAKITEGQIDFESPITASKFQECKRVNQGAKIIIDEDNPTSSPSQNAYYWVYLGVIPQETGDNADDLHARAAVRPGTEARLRVNAMAQF